LRQVPRLALRLEQLCRVCRQEYTVEGRRAGRTLEETARPYEICDCCLQPAPDPRDRNYRARARRWLARYG
jgi:hypothetical protein